MIRSYSIGASRCQVCPEMLFEVGRGDNGGTREAHEARWDQEGDGRGQLRSDLCLLCPTRRIVSIAGLPSKCPLSHGQSGEACRKGHGGVGRRSLALNLWASVVRVGFLAFCCKEAATAREDPSHASGQTRSACPDGGRPG